MKILQLALHACAALGFGPYQSPTQKYPINRKSVQALFIHCLALSSSLAFLFLDANTFQECAMSFYVSTTLMFNIATYVIFIWKNESICKLSKSVEKTVDESESHVSNKFLVIFSYLFVRIKEMHV